MKKIIIILFTLFSLLSVQNAFAWEASYLDVQVESDTIGLDQAVNITITVMDEDDNIVEDYVGDITLYSENDPEVWVFTFPPTFELSDAGRVTLNDIVFFNFPGTHELDVYSFDDFWDVIWGSIELEILSDDVLDFESNEEPIEFPENFSFDLDIDWFAWEIFDSSEENNSLDLNEENVVEKNQESIITSFREEKQSFSFVRESSSDSESFSNKIEENENDKDLIVSSFREETKSFTFVRKISTDKEWAISKIDKENSDRDLVISSFRKERKPFIFVRESFTDSEWKMDISTRKEIAKEMIKTSFRTERKPYTFSRAISTNAEWESSDDETSSKKGLMDMITSSFREVKKSFSFVKKTSTNSEWESDNLSEKRNSLEMMITSFRK